MANTIPLTDIPNWLRRPRLHTPQIIIIHATRGPTAVEQQYRATINWFTNPTNGSAEQRWGSQADAVVGTGPGEITFFGDYHTTRSNWSAGFGGSSATTHGADEWAVSIELAQRNATDPFRDEVLQNAAIVCRQWMDEFHIPAEHLRGWDQERQKDVPKGFVGHDETANGKKLGKSDPGSLFPWDDFFLRVAAVGPTPRRTAEPPPAGGEDVWAAIRRLEQRIELHERQLRHGGGGA